MTIGSTYNHPADLAVEPHSPVLPWAARFPNPPDLCFDYRRLVEQQDGIAQASRPAHRICIVGAGVTGLTVARELLRCGFTHITLIEQARRIGDVISPCRPQLASRRDAPLPSRWAPCACRSSIEPASRPRPAIH